MSRSILQLILCLSVTTSSHAVDYVPPPNGPYQSSSSVIINPPEGQNNEQVEVYRFPQDDLISQPQPSVDELYAPKNPPVTREQAITDLTPSQNENRFSTGLQPGWQQPPANSPSPSMLSPSASVPAYNNPWAVENHNFQYPGFDAYQYPQQNYYWPQYPAKPNNSYPMNMPFQGMPSPWNGMPMNPFSSGR